jgi:hypothetical protein
MRPVATARTWAKAAALLCAVLAAGPVAADGTGGCPARPLPEVIGRPLFDQLTGWLALTTSYDLSTTYPAPPTVSFCQAGEVIAYEGADLLVDPALLAAYDKDRNHIYLARPWALVNLFDQSVVLHEMIHQAQFANRDWPCVGAPELEAYLLQDRWLREHGIRHPFDWAMIRALSRCP